MRCLPRFAVFRFFSSSSVGLLVSEDAVCRYWFQSLVARVPSFLLEVKQVAVLLIRWVSFVLDLFFFFKEFTTKSKSGCWKMQKDGWKMKCSQSQRIISLFLSFALFPPVSHPPSLNHSLLTSLCALFLTSMCLFVHLPVLSGWKDKTIIWIWIMCSNSQHHGWDFYYYTPQTCLEEVIKAIFLLPLIFFWNHQKHISRT